MSTQRVPPRRLLTRLKQDLAELQDDPYPGVSVFTQDANLRELCLVLTPPSGPWVGLALHFTVTLPEQWPILPPKVEATSRIDHPNELSGFICCDILKVFNGAGSYPGGYSPALTLMGLFIQFLTFFSSTKVEQDRGGDVVIGDHIPTCYLLVETVAKYWPPSGEPRPWTDARNEDRLLRMWESTASRSNEVVEEVLIREHILPSKERVTETVQRIMGQDLPVRKLEWVNPRWESTYRVISRHTCDKCPYGSPALPHHQTAGNMSTGWHTVRVPEILSTPPAKCQISKMNDDVLDDLSSYLPSESLISLSKAYSRFREIVLSHHILIRRELNCFFLRIPLKEAILGIGVKLDERTRSLYSDFDWLSLEAFTDFAVRTSAQKRHFGYFLPLAFNRFHFDKSKNEICKRMAIIHTALRSAEAEVSRKTNRPSNRFIDPPAKHHQNVEVIYRMMNNIVVSLMKSCDATMEREKKKRENINYRPLRELMSASEKALTSYCHLFHLLIRLCQSEPAILHDATWKLRNFITKPETRHKSQTPDLGELIVQFMLVLVLPPIDNLTPTTWDALCGKYLEEALIRNVRWGLAAVPGLEVIETGESSYRLHNTFDASKISFRLMMFQIAFLNEFVRTYASNLSQLDDNYGFVDKQLPEKMVIEIKEIYKINNWHEFFKRIEFESGLLLSKLQFCDMLRATVQRSVTLKYHEPATPQRLLKLRGKRAQVDKNAVFAE